MLLLRRRCAIPSRASSWTVASESAIGHVMTPVILLAAVVSGLRAATTDDQQQSRGDALAYQCGRVGVSCQNAQPCLDEQEHCHCDNKTGGYDCGYDTLSLRDSCKVQCFNGATCWLDSHGNERCYCAESYFGDSCQRKRVDVTCEGDGRMRLRLEPFGDRFAGLIYIRDHRVDHGYVTYDAYADPHGYDVDLTLGIPHGSVKRYQGFSHTIEVQTYGFVLAYSPNFISVLDQQILVSCIGIVVLNDSDNTVISRTETDSVLAVGPVSAKLLQYFNKESIAGDQRDDAWTTWTYSASFSVGVVTLMSTLLALYFVIKKIDNWNRRREKWPSQVIYWKAVSLS